jgi:predicted RNase H-like nuclease (RuvC/YqgF family)
LLIMGRRDPEQRGAMNHHHRRLLNEIQANVETIAADVDKLAAKPLPFGLRRDIQEMIRKLDRLAASYESEAKKAREIAERLRNVGTRASVW